MPHAHQSNIEVDKTAKYENAVEYTDAFAALIDALKSDQGEGHLENFQLSRDVDLDFNSIHFGLLADLNAHILQVVGLPVEDITSCSLPGFLIHSPQKAYNQQIKGRAPPVLMV